MDQLSQNQGKRAGGVKGGRVALVTGGGRGIGRAISIALAEAGVDVAINYHRDEASAAATRELIAGLGRRAETFRGSVADPAYCAALVNEVVATFGALNILVNNAGIASRGKHVEHTEPSEVTKVMEVHAFGAFNVTHCALPHLRRGERGDIIFISSINTLTMSARGAPYNMAKAAIEALALTLARETNRDNIRVNTVSPGLTVTDMGSRIGKAVLGVESLSELNERAPFGHICTPEEVAKAAVFLCSESNSYLTGQNIRFDAGLLEPLSY